jgi:DNA-binding IclR family transcriptional regulator
LRDATSCSVFLATWGNRGPTIVFKIDGKRPPVPVPVGYVLPIFNSATGRVFLAHLPHDETEPLLASELRGEKRRGRAIEAVLSAVRREGFAQMEEGATFSGLSAPVLAHDGRIAAALTMSRPNGSGAAERTRLARLLVAAAAAISAKLGYAPR